MPKSAPAGIISTNFSSLSKGSIDILTFEDWEISSEKITIPHPRALERRFVMEPWVEISPEYIILSQSSSIKDIYLDRFNDFYQKQDSEIIEL